MDTPIYDEGLVEEWKWVPGFEGWFKVSSRGRVARFRKINRATTGGRYVVCRELVYPTPCKIGNHFYQRVYLTKKDKKIEKTDDFVHQLVMQAFVGPRPAGLMVCHNDGNAKNNKLHNLRYDTNRENQLDRRAHGTSGIGSKNPNALLTNEKVAKIRKLYSTREYTQAQIANQFGVTRACVCDVVRYKTYPNIGPNGEELDFTEYKEKRKARPSKTYSFCGKTKTIKEWVQETGITETCLRTRFLRGWSVEQALATPVRPRTR